MSDIDPFSTSGYTGEDLNEINSWPEPAKNLMDHSWSLGLHDLLSQHYTLAGEESDPLLRLVQNLLVGRWGNLHALPELIELGTGLNSEKSKHSAAIIAVTILHPFNVLVRRWSEAPYALYGKWKLGSAT